MVRAKRWFLTKNFIAIFIIGDFLKKFNNFLLWLRSHIAIVRFPLGIYLAGVEPASTIDSAFVTVRVEMNWTCDNSGKVTHRQAKYAVPAESYRVSFGQLQHGSYSNVRNDPENRLPDS